MKLFFKNIWMSVFIMMFSCCFFIAKAEKRYAEDVFKRWLDIQYVLSDVDLREMKNILDENNLKDLKDRYENNLEYLKTLIIFYNLNSNKYLEDIFFNSSLPQNSDLIEKFYYMYDLMETNFLGFVDYLIEKDFNKGSVNSEEDKISVDILLSKYGLITQIMFEQSDFFKLFKFMLAVGNRFFEFCYYDKTFPKYKNMLLDKSLYPMARFLHTVVWQYLISFGWKWWHENCLDEIKKRCDAGAQLIYIAGGSDIYMPIKRGIYNIKIVDPFLPSQERFYVQDWQWLAVGNDVRGGIGDEIEFVFDDKIILLKRVEYKILGRMFPILSTGGMVELPESRTIWNVYDVASENKNKFLGKIIFERRFCEQSDFVSGPDKVVLMSTTEMISSIDIEESGGWGIDPYKFDENFEIFVKQLRKPISTSVLCNIRFACENLTNLQYMLLTSDPT
ncbi:hypothetical protein KAT08_01685 [Candidatus Babeliales bacterium]|nr:hypothetical protein [Candidatus Babeliales bacterium]